MPFQLYPQLPSCHSNTGTCKDDLFADLISQRAPQMTMEQRAHRADGLIEAWKAEGLVLKSPPTGCNGGGGRMGSSFDAQRLILLAREQGVEDAMIEEVYSANHERDECLSDWKVLLGCAERAGVRGAEAALRSGWGVRETSEKIEHYRSLGVTAVPVVLLDSPVRAILSSGAPEADFLHRSFAHLVAHGTLPWLDGGDDADECRPASSQLPTPQPKANWQPSLTPAAAPAEDPPTASATAPPAATATAPSVGLHMLLRSCGVGDAWPRLREAGLTKLAPLAARAVEDGAGLHRELGSLGLRLGERQRVLNALRATAGPPGEGGGGGVREAPPEQPERVEGAVAVEVVEEEELVMY